MAWKDTAKQRSMPCNGSLVRRYRERLSWTQEELAQRAGYSVRLIRKAESGGSLHADSIEVIAQTLALAGQAVSPEDLVSNPLALAKEFCWILAEREVEAAQPSAHLLAEDVKLLIPGDPKIYPFAGEFIGVEGYDRFLRSLFSIVYNPDKTHWQPKFVADGNKVLSHGWQKLQMYGADEPNHSILIYEFTVERGKITRIESEYNLENSYRYFRKYSVNIGSDGNSEGRPPSP